MAKWPLVIQEPPTSDLYGLIARYFTRMTNLTSKMTGLNLAKDKIIEIAALITDKHLNLLDPEGFERVIYCPESTLAGMDEWCIEHHGNVPIILKFFYLSRSQA